MEGLPQLRTILALSRGTKLTQITCADPWAVRDAYIELMTLMQERTLGAMTEDERIAWVRALNQQRGNS